MTSNRRIFLNIVVTYGRSLFSLACGLLTARWVLMALGLEDLGLYGVVGGMMLFIAFLNMLLSGALRLFFAFTIGDAQPAIATVYGAGDMVTMRKMAYRARKFEIGVV